MLRPLACLLLLPLGLAAAQPEQLLTLGDSAKPRFPLTEIVWPGQPGEAAVCLWQDDRYAACSITIDDNNRPDHEWWLATCARLDIRVTFFVITGGVDGANKGYAGTWEDWRKMRAAGHEIASHSVSHPKTGDTDPDAVTLQEYVGSQQAIEKNLPGHRCLTMAYPNGKGRPDLAAGLFVAVRGVAGVPAAANQINYLNTSIGSADPDQINAILGRPVTKLAWLNRPAFRRAWIQPLYHLVAHGKTAEERQAGIAKVEGQLTALVAERERIWIDTFAAVAIYGQERDSATLTTVASTPDRIVLTLSDRMRDDIFDRPLTLKVRLPDTWKTVTATQATAAIAARHLLHEGRPYALVQAVPDRGEIVLVP